MKYLLLEHKLNEIAGYDIVDGPFYNIAGALEGILDNEKTTGNEKADALNKLLTEWLNDNKNKFTNGFKFVTPQEYANAVGKSRETISRWLNAGKIPNAHSIGSGRSKKWIIVTKQ